MLLKPNEIKRIADSEGILPAYRSESCGLAVCIADLKLPSGALQRCVLVEQVGGYHGRPLRLLGFRHATVSGKTEDGGSGVRERAAWWVPLPLYRSTTGLQLGLRLLLMREGGAKNSLELIEAEAAFKQWREGRTKTNHKATKAQRSR